MRYSEHIPRPEGTSPTAQLAGSEEEKRKVRKIVKKKKTPWKSVNRFMKRKSTKTVGHPVWVYRKRGRAYKYLTFTHTPTNEADFEKLKYNIDPDDISSCYVKKQYEVNDRDAFKDADKKYRIHEKDKDTVKKYQK